MLSGSIRFLIDAMRWYLCHWQFPLWQRRQAAELSPGDLDHVFFTLGGFDAMDSVIRMVRYYFNARGEGSKKHFIALEKRYHGSNSNGAASNAEIIAQGVANLKAKVAELGAENTAAFIMKLVQGSGGAIVPPEGYATAMQETCRELGILFIVDEIITGFSRAGPMFSCEHEGLTPDFLTTTKGLTSDYAPMGAVSSPLFHVVLRLKPPLESTL